jgi:hypothetical protein
MDNSVINIESQSHILSIFCDGGDSIYNPRTQSDNINHFVTKGYKTGEDESHTNDILRKVAKALGFNTYDKSNLEIVIALSQSKNKKIEKYIIIKELYVYDHGGVSFSMSPFSCPWDSGQAGFIVSTRYDYENVGLKFEKEKVIDQMERDVELWDKYCRNEIYGFTIEDKDGEVLESVGGFIDYLDDVLEEVKKSYLHDYPDLIEACKKNSS